MSKTPNETPQDATHKEISEAIIVASKRVACDGGGGALGHPKTWLDMGQEREVTCKYCDQVFQLSTEAINSAP